MKHLFIVNPTAGGKDRTSEVRAKVEEAFSTREGQYEIYVTRAPLDATEKIKAEAGTGEHIRAYACGEISLHGGLFGQQSDKTEPSV